MGPLLMTESDSPHYTRAFSIFMLADIIAVVLSLMLRWIHVYANRRKNELLEQGKSHILVGDRTKFLMMDLTDVEDPRFVYKT